MSRVEKKTNTIHANCLFLGDKGILLTGPSGCGKSALTLALIERAEWAKQRALLVSDDYTEILEKNGRLYGRPPAALAGGIEIRGAGLYAMAFKEEAVIDFVVTLGEDYERFPTGKMVSFCGIEMPVFNLPGLNTADGLTICQAIEALCFKTLWQKSDQVVKSC